MIARRSGPRSKGPKRYLFRRFAHQPVNILIREPRSEKVERMMQALSDQGWTFHFHVEAHSPRGNDYRGSGVSLDEAFLVAFGLWRRDLLASYRKPASNGNGKH